MPVTWEERHRREAHLYDAVTEYVREGYNLAIRERRNAAGFLLLLFQRGATVPLSAPEFYAGLRRDFPERDTMYFLPDQVPEYEEQRATVTGPEQLALFVTDEQSTVQWLRAQLSTTPQTYQDLLPQFLREIHQASHEQLPELSEILEQNFIRDADGRWRLAAPGKQEDLDALRDKALCKEFDGYAAAKAG